MLCLAGLFSCEDGPVSDENWTPELVSVESQPSANSARLKATLSSELQAVCEYGFYYGSDKESLEKVTALPDEKSFTAELKGLEASTKYFFKAYISNGKTYIYSDISEFTTRESYDFLSITDFKHFNKTPVKKYPLNNPEWLPAEVFRFLLKTPLPVLILIYCCRIKNASCCLFKTNVNADSFKFQVAKNR